MIATQKISTSQRLTKLEMLNGDNDGKEDRVKPLADQHILDLHTWMYKFLPRPVLGVNLPMIWATQRQPVGIHDRDVVLLYDFPTHLIEQVARKRYCRHVPSSLFGRHWNSHRMDFGWPPRIPEWRGQPYLWRWCHHSWQYGKVQTLRRRSQCLGFPWTFVCQPYCSCSLDPLVIVPGPQRQQPLSGEQVTRHGCNLCAWDSRLLDSRAFSWFIVWMVVAVLCVFIGSADMALTQQLFAANIMIGSQQPLLPNNMYRGSSHAFIPLIVVFVAVVVFLCELLVVEMVARHDNFFAATMTNTGHDQKQTTLETPWYIQGKQSCVLEVDYSVCCRCQCSLWVVGCGNGGATQQLFCSF